jgi:pimeloyl-ACP methyl ester carboxylesterase
MTMLVDLVQVTTRDGVRLDGAYQAAASPPSIPVDAFCLVHGTGGNFYGSTLFDELAQRLLARGCGVLRVNTRGHDGISSAVTARGGRRLGAAYEVVDDCRHDVAAWMAWLADKAGPRVGVIGHSLGAVKALYALANEVQLKAACLVALSPPRLSYSWFCSSPEGRDFLETCTQADQLMTAGEPAALLDVKLPLPFVITAAGYVEKYGPDERYNYLRFVHGVSCPVLLTFGAIEANNNMAFRGAAEALATLAARRPQLSVTTIAGADHFYTGVREALFQSIE